MSRRLARTYRAWGARGFGPALKSVNIARKCSRFAHHGKRSLRSDESEEAMLPITLSEAKDLIARTEAGAKEGNLFGVIMPNGKPLKDCTGEYLHQLGQAMQELGFRMK
jgi:hypothetical protein